VPSNVRSLRAICLPQLTGAKAWWLASTRVKSFVEARLRGQEQPAYRKVIDERTLGIELIVDWSFVHKAIRHQGIYKNRGE
jgi:hypothetical protein